MIAPYQELEHAYADFVNSKYAVSCNTGTAALHLALLALNIKAGDEVIVPDFCMAACAFAVSYCGATPIFVDVDPVSYGLDPEYLEEAITDKTRAIIVVHTYGRLADMKAILEIARKHNLAVVEDASEAHGAVHKSKADLTCYSFYRNKIIHAEEGGIVTTDNKELAKRMNFLKNMAFTPAHDYFHPEIGFNYRMPDTTASQVLMSLKEYRWNNDRRRAIEALYDRLVPSPLTRRDAVWFYEVIGKPTKDAQEIGIRLPFKPLSSLPMYGGHEGKPISLMLSKFLVLLPANPDLQEGELEYVCSKITFPEEGE